MRLLNWVEAECKLSLMVRPADDGRCGMGSGKSEIISHLEPTAIYDLAAPSTPETVRREVLSLLERGQKPAPKAVR